MSGFSTRSEECIERRLSVELLPVCNAEQDLIERYDLHKCVEWINENKFKKVCLQFPDSLLNDSVHVALWLETRLKEKLYILGDTSYGSCCVDEVAAEHVNADSIIHFGHSCLSPTVRLPVLYIFAKCSLDVTKCVDVIKEHCANNPTPTCLLILGVEYAHYIKSFQDGLSDFNVVVAEPVTSERHKMVCSKACCLLNNESKHSTYKLGRGYCLDSSEKTVIFFGNKESRLLYNYRISFSGFVYCYSSIDGQLEPISVGKLLQRRWYLIERVRDAKSVGLIVGTLGIRGYLEAINHVSKLIRRKGKKCYVISIGKPTVAKLANFPEIEVYIMISCPEAVLENEKEFYQPIVSVMEAEMALNEARPWSGTSSSDFRDIIPGGSDYVELPDNIEADEPDVSLLSNKIRINASDVEDSSIKSSQDGTLQLRANMTLDNISNNLSNRSWRGLDPALGKVPVVKAVQGRSGVPQAYTEEEGHSVS